VEYEPLTFTVHTDEATRREWIHVDRFPNAVLISEHLLRSADPARLRRDPDGTIRVVADNGSAIYRVVGRDPAIEVLGCELVESTELLGG
jgi:hypothetical protein